MKRVVILASAGALAFLTGGCSYFSFLPWVDDPGIEGVVEEVPTPAPEETPTADFEEPVEPGGQPGVVGLVQPTNPNERIRQLEQGREDPFSVIPIEPVLIPDEPETPVVADLPSPGGAGTPAPGGAGTATAGGTAPAQGNGGGAGQTPSGTAQAPGGTQLPPPGTPERSIPKLEPGQPVPGEEGLKTPLPPGLEFPQSQPAIASAIAVSGVVQVGTTPKAIVKAPNEDYSRYVQPGEYISNGQVLVKRIEMGGGLYPTVIFEENGMEIGRQVGAGGQTEEEETPTAFVTDANGNV